MTPWYLSTFRAASCYFESIGVAKQRILMHFSFLGSLPLPCLVPFVYFEVAILDLFEVSCRVATCQEFQLCVGPLNKIRQQPQLMAVSADSVRAVIA